MTGKMNLTLLARIVCLFYFLKAAIFSIVDLPGECDLAFMIFLILRVLVLVSANKHGFFMIYRVHLLGIGWL